MSTREMIEEMAAKAYWKSPGRQDAVGHVVLGHLEGGEDQGRRGPVQEGGARQVRPE
jgi:hypothetical protein